MAPRPGHGKAQAMVSALHAMGLPAAVLRPSGRIIATNPPFEEVSGLFVTVACGGLALADRKADALFQEAIAARREVSQPVMRSIPVSARDDRPALILHVLPLRRAAHESVMNADTLMVVTEVGAGLMVPSPAILAGLFDLTPAEARLATALASGKVLREAAALSGITIKTGRSYLESIFRKTGTRQQSELIALLKSAGALLGETAPS